LEDRTYAPDAASYQARSITVGGTVIALAAVIFVANQGVGSAGVRPTAFSALRHSGSQTQPIAGYYQYSSQLTAQSGCGLRPGLKQSHIFYYPGPNATGSRYFQQHNANVIHYSTYPTTPVVGVTTWTGSFQYWQAPGGQMGSGTLSATLSFYDPNVFFAQETDVIGSCTQTWQGSYLRIGAGP